MRMIGFATLHTFMKNITEIIEIFVSYHQCKTYLFYERQNYSDQRQVYIALIKIGVISNCSIPYIPCGFKFHWTSTSHREALSTHISHPLSDWIHWQLIIRTIPLIIDHFLTLKYCQSIVKVCQNHSELRAFPTLSTERSIKDLALRWNTIIVSNSNKISSFYMKKIKNWV